ncbi:hypothetical protein TorRG33x02_309870, partial [Trema orientale]
MSECFLVECFVGERSAKTWPPLEGRQRLFDKSFFKPMIPRPSLFKPITQPSYSQKNLLVSDLRLPSG